MNKIIVNKSVLKLQDESVLIEEIKESLELHILGNVECIIKGLCDNANLEIYMEEDSYCILEFSLLMKEQKNKIFIHSGKKSTLDFHYSCIYSDKNSLEIENDVTADDVNTNIAVRLVENKGSIEVKALGCIEKDVLNTVYMEDIKALVTNGDSVKIMPDLIVLSDSVIANHNATISNIEENNLFYLMSHGVKKEAAEELLKSGFLKSILKINNMK